jgi:hypothetical protein
MTSPFNFSLQETNQKIFLHAVDGQFENSTHLEKKSSTSRDFMHDLNVKFLLSLDGDEDINDISTELNSEGEESMRDSYTELKVEVGDQESQKLKISSFMSDDYSIMKTEIEKIKTETVKGLRAYQMQLYNKMISLQQIIRSGQGMGNMGNSFSMTPNAKLFLENKIK